jgi:integrase
MTATETRARRGQGSVAWIESKGRYRISVPRRDRPGEPIREWFAGPESPARRAAAEDRRIEMLADRNAGGSVAASGTVAEWLDEWMGLQSGKPDTTIRAYRSRVDLYLVPTLGRYQLRNLKATDIARAFDKLRLPADQRPRPRDGRAIRGRVLSESTIQAAHKVLTAALNDAMRTDPPRIRTNPAEQVRVQDDAPEIEPPTIAQVVAIMSHLSQTADPYYAFYQAARWSGARQGELFGLRRSDVDRNERTLTFRRQVQRTEGRRRGLKAGRTRSVVVPQYVVDAILDQPIHQRSPYAFTRADGTGRPLTQGVMRGHFDRMLARLGICPPPGADLDHFRLHDLRHAFATMLREAGAIDALLAAAMGHSSVTMLERYSHIRVRRGGQAFRLVVDSLGAEDARDYYGIRA